MQIEMKCAWQLNNVLPESGGTVSAVHASVKEEIEISGTHLF